MKRQLEPVWTKSQLKAGQQMSQAWEEFFSAAEQQGKAAKDEAPGLADDAKVDEVVRRHEADLLGYANVVGVAKGLRMRQGRPSSELCVTVYVERKIPATDLAAADILPKEIEGIPVDVAEVGKLEAL